MDGKQQEDGYVLALETSGAIGSVALGWRGDCLGSRVFSKPRAHVRELFPAIDELCEEHGAAPKDISQIHVSAGPGSFTGLRLGVTAARALASVTGAKIVAVPTLEVIAQNAGEVDAPPDTVVVILDAKRHNVYAATFELSNGRYIPIDESREVSPAEYLRGRDAGCAVLGEGVRQHREAVQSSSLRVLPESLFRPRAETVFALGTNLARKGKFVDPLLFVPVYIRLPEAEEKWSRR